VKKGRNRGRGDTQVLLTRKFRLSADGFTGVKARTSATLEKGLGVLSTAAFTQASSWPFFPFSLLLLQTQRLLFNGLGAMGGERW